VAWDFQPSVFIARPIKLQLYLERRVITNMADWQWLVRSIAK